MENSCYPYNSRLLGSTEVSLAEVIYKGTDKVDKPLEGRLAEPKSVSLLLYMKLYPFGTAASHTCWGGSFTCKSIVHPSKHINFNYYTAPVSKYRAQWSTAIIYVLTVITNREYIS